MTLDHFRVRSAGRPTLCTAPVGTARLLVAIMQVRLNTHSLFPTDAAVCYAAGTGIISFEMRARMSNCSNWEHQLLICEAVLRYLFTFVPAFVFIPFFIPAFIHQQRTLL